MTLSQRIRDWIRGWSESDRLSAQKKIAAMSIEPGAWVELTNREMRAVTAQSA